MTDKLFPRLVVAGADRAIDFYTSALGAKLLERFAEDDGHVVHAALSLGDVIISLTDERKEWNNVAPTSLGGSPVILNLVVEEVDEIAARMVEQGATVIFPVADQFYGHREGRFEDPFGHIWIITKIIETLTPEQIEARMNGEAD